MLEGTCRLLAERLKVGPAELESILGMVRSQLDVSLSGPLKQTET